MTVIFIWCRRLTNSNASAYNDSSVHVLCANHKSGLKLPLFPIPHSPCAVNLFMSVQFGTFLVLVSVVCGMHGIFFSSSRSFTQKMCQTLWWRLLFDKEREKMEIKLQSKCQDLLVTSLPSISNKPETIKRHHKGLFLFMWRNLV